MPLPPVVASSKYVDYSTWEDASVICMEDSLARWDRFIEETAEFLEVEPPSRRIQYVWIAFSPDGERDFDWSLSGCGKGVSGCYQHQASEPRAVVYSKQQEHLHELVHAVDIAALGSTHPVLLEGLATYLGSGYSAREIDAGFPEAFKAMIEAALSSPEDYSLAIYSLAMQFVGSILARDGVEKFKKFRASVPADADLPTFAAAYEETYGENLDAALDAMSAQAVQSRAPLSRGCEVDAELVPWVSPGVMDTMLYGECGDGSFYGGGFVDDGPGFAKDFAVEVTEPGFYEMTIDGPGAKEGQLRGTLDLCSGDMASSVSATHGETGYGPLVPGRHALSVSFPQAAEPRGELRLRLEWVAPPKP